MAGLRFGAAVAIATTVMAATAAQASAPYIGEIRTFGGSECPQLWLPTDGRMLHDHAFPELAALLGDSYGSDSRTTFAIPKLPPLQSRDGRPEIRCIAAFGVYPRR